MLHSLPINVLQHIFFEYATINDMSNFASLCVKTKVLDEFWRAALVKNTSLSSSRSSRSSSSLSRSSSSSLAIGRSLRSTSSPRISFFSTIRLSRQRLHHRLYMSTRSLLDKTDSTRQLAKIFKDMTKREFVDLYAGIQLGDLMLHAAYKQRWKCLKFFITELRVDKNYESKSGGATVLIIAAWAGKVDIVKWLLSLPDNESNPLNIFTQGELQYTSACGGAGPYTARVWAQRKALVCGFDNPGFKACEVLLKMKEESVKIG